MTTSTLETAQDIKRETKQVAKNERRSNHRCKLTQSLRVRPSDPEVEHFEEIRGTTSLSRSGVYFKGEVKAYHLGMRLFVTLPYSDQPTAISREYLAEVVRLDKLDSGLIGVGIKLLMDMGFKAGSESTARSRR
ncbi:MAG TPA: PilZ domain-containing protein [Candidatus Dormibacteraeota bacterium]|nr:PilZ domain-containing protein [Candidatus Dormibacteraeota bacterium]